MEWLLQNIDKMAAALLALIALAEAIVRLTPTEKDDGAVERVGAIIRKLLDVLKVPNKKV